MQTNNKFFDDLSKLATGAAGALHSARGEMEDSFRVWLDRQLAQMDLVSREEHDVVRAMAEKARLENTELRTELEALAKKMAKLSK